MTILQKLHKIEESKVIYNIHYCRAGVGFSFYYPEKVKDKTPRKFKIGDKEIVTDCPENWREGLSVDRYYPTFEEAVEAEYENL